jgi:hypothetical protein
MTSELKMCWYFVMFTHSLQAFNNIEIGYSGDRLLIEKSSFSLSSLLLVMMEFLLILVAVLSSLLDASRSFGVVVREIFDVVADSTFACEDFPNVNSGNCTAKIIDNNNTKFIIAWKHDIK